MNNAIQNQNLCDKIGRTSRISIKENFFCYRTVMLSFRLNKLVKSLQMSESKIKKNIPLIVVGSRVGMKAHT